MTDWPTYDRATVEDLDVHLENFDQPVTDFDVAVTPFGTRPSSSGWHPQPYRINGLPPGRYDAWTRWQPPTGASVVDHVGEPGLPSFEVI